MPPDATQLEIKPWIFAKERVLFFGEEYLEYDNRNQKGAAPLRLLKSEIAEYRYGVKWIQFDMFTFGRTYFVEIRDKQQKTIRIQLSSVFRIGKRDIGQKLDLILDTFYTYWVEGKVNDYLQKISDGEQVEICGVAIDSKGVNFESKIGLVTWQDLGTAEYRQYYALYVRNDARLYKHFEYKHHWNTVILFGVTRTILRSLGIPFSPP